MATAGEAATGTKAPKRKRAHKTLTIDEKVEILKDIGKKSYQVLADKYGVGVSTIADIKKKREKILCYKRKAVEMGCKRPARVMRLGRDEQLEEALFIWFRQKREEGIPLTGELQLFHH